MKKISWLFFCLVCFASSHAQAASTYNKTIGGIVYGSIPLVDTLPNVDLGIGGGAYFDYRMNQRFSVTLEAFAITQDGTSRSNGEGSIEFMGIPTVTFKIYFMDEGSKLDPYAGIGVGFFLLTEGNLSDSTGGAGLGAQVEVGLDYLLNDHLSVGVAGTFRSVGLITKLSGAANATTYMPYTLLGKIGYHF